MEVFQWMESFMCSIFPFVIFDMIYHYFNLQIWYELKYCVIVIKQFCVLSFAYVSNYQITGWMDCTWRGVTVRLICTQFLNERLLLKFNAPECYNSILVLQDQTGLLPDPEGDHEDSCCTPDVYGIVISIFMQVWLSQCFTHNWYHLSQISKKINKYK